MYQNLDNISVVNIKNVNIFCQKEKTTAAKERKKQKLKLKHVLVRKGVRKTELELSFPLPFKKNVWLPISETAVLSWRGALGYLNGRLSKNKVWEKFRIHSRISFVFSNQFLFSFLSISSEAGLEIDSQQEEEPVQASDESDLPSTSQDPPSSSSVGKFLLLTTVQLLYIKLVCKRSCSVS